jgi:RimJ/RimL family protein N-acetyltransferase
MDFKNQLLTSLRNDTVISKCGKALKVEGKDVWDLSISIYWKDVGKLDISNASIYDLWSIKNWFLSLYPRSRHYLSLFPCDERIEEFIGQHLKSNEKHQSFILNAWQVDKLIAHFFISDIKQKKPVIGIGISDKYQRKKLGYFLIRILLEASKLLGFKSIYLSTMIENKNAFKLYNDIGFKHIKNIKVPVPGYDYKTEEYEMEFIL